MILQVMAGIFRRLLHRCSDQRIRQQIVLREAQEGQGDEEPLRPELSVIRRRHFPLQRTLHQGLRKDEANRSHRIRILIGCKRATKSNTSYDTLQKSNQIKYEF